MADVRCPMCSKVNSPDADVCAFCGARLKPLMPGSTSAASKPPEQPKGDETDWLSSLRSTGGLGENTPPGETPAAAEPDGEVPDWLSRIRDRAKSETGGAEESADGENEALPDWLSGLQEPGDSAPAQDTSSPASGGQAGEEDWFSRLGGAESSSSDQGITWPAEPSTGGTGSEPSPFDIGQGSEPGQPAQGDWSDTFSSWQSDAAPEPSSAQAGEDLSWLSNLGPIDQESSKEEPQEPRSSGSGLTGFLSSLENETGAPAEPPQPQGGQEPDWTRSFSESESSDLPDWISSTPAETTPESEGGSQTVGDISAWLAGLDAQETTGEETPQSPAQPVEGLPDWLSAAEEQPQAPAPSAEDLSGIPGWMGAVESDLPSSDETAVPETPAGQKDLPDWFTSFRQPEETAALSFDETPAEEEPALPFAADLPGFTMESDETPPAEPEAAEAAGTPAPFLDEGSPAWLRDFAAPAAEESETGIPAFIDSGPQGAPQPGMEEPFTAELPDWLEDEHAETTDAGTPAAAGPVNDDLARAELPSWVAAMRPVESFIPEEAAAGETGQSAEKAGPLAGLRGILPLAENLFRYRKPAIYSAKLRVTDKQRAQASLLEKILAEEAQPLLLPEKGMHAPRVILRILVALALVFTLLIPSFLGPGFPALSQPVLYPAELLNMFDQIDKNLPQGQDTTVLLAVDYEPGLSGEMNAAAAPVISHLMSKNVRIAVISTVPTGPFLADQMLRQAATASAPGYIVDDWVVNLGYLPGGTISLLEFIRQPQIAAPATLAGRPAWQETFLSQLSGFPDFAQVILLTDTAETGRNWVEQVSPYIGSVPFFVVASAQAAPLLVPYLSEDMGQAQPAQKVGGRIDGMVSGLMGGAQYGWVAQQANNPASRYWATYQVGMVLAIVVILAGGLYSGLKRLFANSDRDGA